METSPSPSLGNHRPFGSKPMSQPLPLVLHLQANALDPQMSASDLLRRAKMVATKLAVTDALRWIDDELEGYPKAVGDALPPYRLVRGQPICLDAFAEWRRLVVKKAPIAEFMTTARLFISVAVLESILMEVGNGEVHFSYYNMYSRSEYFMIAALFAFHKENITSSALSVSASSVWTVLDNVRNVILDWALELETWGILGEGMRFTLVEREKAGAVTYNYFAQNIGVAGDVGGQAQLHNEQE